MMQYTDRYSELEITRVLERMGVPQDKTVEIFTKCPAVDGRVSVYAVQKVLEQDRNTEALDIHTMIAAMRVEDQACLDHTNYLSPDRVPEIER